jgi:hypothetical protein
MELETLIKQEDKMSPLAALEITGHRAVTQMLTSVYNKPAASISKVCNCGNTRTWQQQIVITAVTTP